MSASSDDWAALRRLADMGGALVSGVLQAYVIAGFGGAERICGSAYVAGDGRGAWR